MADRARAEAKDHLLSSPEPVALTQIASRIQAVAEAGGSTIGTAESCTGGLVGHAITEIAGSSAYYRGGVISYSNDLKTEILGVSAEVIERHGAVSAQVARLMAAGVRSMTGADYGLAVTGVAGPGGGTPRKPVGLTYVAASGPRGSEVQRHLWSGGRSDNKRRSAAAAMDLLLDMMETEAGERDGRQR